jgi:carbonic anhydrase
MMNRRHALKLFAGLALCPLCKPALAAEGAHWSYEGTGAPAKWGDLDAANKACAIGQQQSPIDIGPTLKSQLPPLGLRWPNSADTIVNNGHTIQLNLPEGGTLRVGNDVYKLVQFHFHHPSEHRINGKGTAMEVHFVHAAPSGGYGVVGVMMKAGRHNASFARIAATMPTQEGPPVRADPAIDPNGLLPIRRGYFDYAGSLTTPPCGETVAWMVLGDPIEVAGADVERFAKLFADNARPVQKLNRRFLLRS